MSDIITCKRNKQQNGNGRRMNVICGKPAKFFQEDGLPLCETHFKKWFKKVYKVEYKDFISKSKEVGNGK